MIRQRLSPDAASRSASVSDFLASRTTRNKFLLLPGGLVRSVLSQHSRCTETVLFFK